MFEIRLFGNFQITKDNVILHQDTIRSDMMTKLMAYLLINRNRNININEFADILWSENESENPLGALKNLVYRIRKLLSKTFGENDYILTNHSSYAWNPKIEVVIDCELFEQKCKEAEEFSGEVNEKIEKYERALQIYNGEFMSGFSTLQWVIPVSAYFHSIFLSYIEKLMNIYKRQRLYGKMEKMCTNALKLDSTDEMLHCMLIKSLMLQNKLELANDYLKRAQDMLRNVLDVRKSEQFMKLQGEIYKLQNCSMTSEIKDVYKEISSLSNTGQGAYICSYLVFREIYRLEYRRMERKQSEQILPGDSEYILLLSLSLQKGASVEGNDQYNNYQILRAMNYMEEILKDCLRKSDVAARYSNSQFILLLPSLDYQDCLLVSNRITTNLYNRIGIQKIKIKRDLIEINTNQKEQRESIQFII